MIERSDLVTVDDPVIGPIRQQAPFPRRVGESQVAPAGAPRLGEHTRAVLHDLLDLSDTELDRLTTAGVI
jgi:formyl-CoA transferase